LVVAPPGGELQLLGVDGEDSGVDLDGPHSGSPSEPGAGHWISTRGVGVGHWPVTTHSTAAGQAVATSTAVRSGFGAQPRH
jgi:hypothetical protein